MPRVSTYPDATLPVAAGELLYLVQGGNSRKVAVSGLRSVLAATPQAGAGVGVWQRTFHPQNTTVSLPAGGTWAFFYVRRNTSTGGVNAVDGSVAAGGTILLGLGAGEDLNMLTWRIA
jgi:hypothetical protein